jgi:hypothetical protein
MRAQSFLLIALAAPAAAQEPQGEWNLTTGARESNEFSRVFNGLEQEDLILDNFHFSLGYQTRTEKSQYGLFGRVGANAYREAENSDRLNYGGGFSWSYTPSTRFNSTLQLAADKGFQGETLSNLGVLAPGVDTSAVLGSWSFEYLTGPRTTLSVALAYDYVRFESGDPIPGSQIVLGQAPFRDEFRRLLRDPEPDDIVPLPDAEGDVLDILAREGFLAGDNRSHSGTAIVGLSHQVSEYSSLGFDFGAGYRSVDTLDARYLSEGAQGAFRFWTQRRQGPSGTLALSYEVSRSLVTEPATTVQSAIGGYSISSDRFAMRLTGGASYYLAENDVSSVAPVADVSVDAEVTRTTRFSAAYRRQFSQALGFGSTLLIDYGSVSFTQQFGPKVDLALLAGGTFGADPQIEGSRYDAWQWGGTLTYRIVESFHVGGSFFALDTEQVGLTAFTDTTRNLASVFVTYTAHWR